MRLQLSPSQIVTAVLTLSALRSRGRAHHPQLSPTPSDQQRTRVAIDQLYARLPEAFSKAGLLGRSVELWGVTLSTAHSPSAAERALLRSFLRVREWDVDDTVYMLGEALRWRRIQRVDRMRPEKVPPRFPRDRFGTDRDGRPLVLLSFEHVTPEVFKDTHSFVAWRVRYPHLSAYLVVHTACSFWCRFACLSNSCAFSTSHVGSRAILWCIACLA